MTVRVAKLVLFDRKHPRASWTRLGLAFSPLVGTIILAAVAIIS